MIIQDLRENPNWTEKYPMVFVANNRLRAFCIHCQKPAMADYMVRTEIWKEAVPVEYRRSLVHIECLEEMLGRPLVFEDFTDVPLNQALLFGYKLGQREKK